MSQAEDPAPSTAQRLIGAGGWYGPLTVLALALVAWATWPWTNGWAAASWVLGCVWILYYWVIERIELRCGKKLMAARTAGLALVAAGALTAFVGVVLLLV